MPDQRETFLEASDFFLSVAERVHDDQWASPGLGVWTVRELVAHTGLAFANAEREITTLGRPAGTDDSALRSAVDFYQQGMADAGRQRTGRAARARSRRIARRRPADVDSCARRPGPRPARPHP